jgi:hypothetical protein
MYKKDRTMNHNDIDTTTKLYSRLPTDLQQYLVSFVDCDITTDHCRNRNLDNVSAQCKKYCKQNGLRRLTEILQFCSTSGKFGVHVGWQARRGVRNRLAFILMGDGDGERKLSKIFNRYTKVQRYVGREAPYGGSVLYFKLHFPEDPTKTITGRKLLMEHWCPLGHARSRMYVNNQYIPNELCLLTIPHIPDEWHALLLAFYQWREYHEVRVESIAMLLWQMYDLYSRQLLSSYVEKHQLNYSFEMGIEYNLQSKEFMDALYCEDRGVSKQLQVSCTIIKCMPQGVRKLPLQFVYPKQVSTYSDRDKFQLTRRISPFKYDR